MELGYSLKLKDEGKAVKAMGRDLNISFKDAVVLSDALRGKKLSEALKLVGEVISLKTPVPYKRFQTGVGHRKGTQTHKIAKYPKKAASEALKVLGNLESNAEYKGLDTDKLTLTHIQAQKGFARRRRKPKGRWRMWTTQRVHIQAIAEEK